MLITNSTSCNLWRLVCTLGCRPNVSCKTSGDLKWMVINHLQPFGLDGCWLVPRCWGSFWPPVVRWKSWRIPMLWPSLCDLEALNSWWNALLLTPGELTKKKVDEVISWYCICDGVDFLLDFFGIFFKRWIAHFCVVGGRIFSIDATLEDWSSEDATCEIRCGCQ